ncbi:MULTISPECIES: hypothetical protein [Marinobacter]|uniref:Uncharacterized protein n=1 Tax=Marinobacter metalliresistant TaxID=2961995 RepID=A0ABZ2W2B1_9GAMM|nr:MULTISPECIES: hypothetical protein [unclassified Marinobacter]AXS85100.1 hypothetical protein D0851_20050 [Marinobacter sp. Arc7-DN-1]|tara:strand:+ start:305 stop:496 length:192 start_codon:yes stop_codon:yes gene_type:complete
MNKTINGAYQDHVQAKNAWDDLIATGIPRDNIFIDEEAKVVKVSVPAETEREILEIFERHQLN